MAIWIVLSTEWKLEDVQAGLNVIITVLCTTFILTSSRFFWHRSANQISKDHGIHLTSLLTFTSLGEVIDVIGLFKAQLFQPRHAMLGAQCFVVVFFSLAGMLAGPISRYSTRVGEIVEPKLVQGHLASRSLSCDVNDNVRWQQVFNNLEKADFPHDQLLDFLPELDSNWVYVETEWNSTYSAACIFTPQTNIILNATGNYVNDTLLAFYYEIPGLWDILSPRFQNETIVHDLFYDGYRNPANGVWDDVIMWQYVELTPSDVSEENNITTQTQEISFSLASIYMKNAPEYNLSALGEGAKDWAFGIGEIPLAFYTKVECDIRRNRPPQDQNYWEAYPQIRTNCDLAQQLDVYWSPTAIQPSIDGFNSIINIPSAEDIFRFYQAWMISKDTYYSYPTSKNISLKLATVELSIPFVVICVLTILVVIFGLMHWGLFKIYHSGKLEGIPETKVGWMLQSVREAQISLPLQLSSPVNFKQNQLEKKPGNVREMWKHATFSWQQDQDRMQKRSGKIQVNNYLPPDAPLLSPSIQVPPEITLKKDGGVQFSVTETERENDKID